MLYAEEMGLGDDTKDFLWDVIRKLDEIFLKRLQEKQDAASKKK